MHDIKVRIGEGTETMTGSLSTGMMDATGRTIFEDDRVVCEDGMEGLIVFDDCSGFRLEKREGGGCVIQNFSRELASKVKVVEPVMLADGTKALPSECEWLKMPHWEIRHNGRTLLAKPLSPVELSIYPTPGWAEKPNV